MVVSDSWTGSEVPTGTGAVPTSESVVTMMCAAVVVTSANRRRGTKWPRGMAPRMVGSRDRCTEISGAPGASNSEPTSARRRPWLGYCQQICQRSLNAADFQLESSLRLNSRTPHLPWHVYHKHPAGLPGVLWTRPTLLATPLFQYLLAHSQWAFVLIT